MNRFRISTQAAQDIEDIWEYLAPIEEEFRSQNSGVRINVRWGFRPQRKSRHRADDSAALATQERLGF